MEGVDDRRFGGLFTGEAMAYSAGVRAPRGPRTLAWCRSLACIVGFAAMAVVGCYDGLDDAEPPPGSPGGLCHPETKTCDLGYPCEPVGQYCYDPVDPCRGVFCNGHGTCFPDADKDLPVCMCEVGYSNYRYTLYCEPV